MTEEKVVTTEHMDALKRLAEVNIEISNARTILSKLKDDTADYISEREKKTLERIKQVLEDSRELINETKNNYEEISNFANTVSSFAKSLVEAYGKLQSVFALVDEHSELWDKELTAQHETIADLRKGITQDKTYIASEKEGIERSKVTLAQEQIKIDDQRGTLQRAIERLKQKRV